MLKRKISGLAIILLVMSGSSVIFHKGGFMQETKVALAEDEEDDEEYEDEPVRVIDTDPENEKPAKTETKTIYTKLSDTVTQTTATVIRHDSDGDGAYDDEDEHPTINDNFIVKDADSNGIDDKYEQ